MGKLLGGQPAPAALTLVTECPPLPQGGAAAIAAWLDRNPHARMVVIDVFAEMRGASPVGPGVREVPEGRGRSREREDFGSPE